MAAFYNIIDQIFIANASYLGSYGNAANTVVFPMTVIATAIAVGGPGAIFWMWVVALFSMATKMIDARLRRI